MFLSIFIAGLGIPHFFFVVMNALLGKKTSSVGKKIFHAIQFCYYLLLFVILIHLIPEIIEPWKHQDSIDNLIQIQMILLPFVLLAQLVFISPEWFYHNLKPHEVLEQTDRTRRNKGQNTSTI
ncbi:MAG: hypothetical protein GC180_10980 [Bacteroidetes bacterium]|nr:hypothetical protein [Bacteroidota bacterium]